MRMFKAEVINTPPDVKSGYIVAQRDSFTAELWYYDSFDTLERAYDVAQELDDGVVLESVDE